MTVNLVFCSSYTTRVLSPGFLHVGDLLPCLGLKDADWSCYILCNGRKVTDDINLEDGKTYHIVPRLPGGKGGFGSMLRAIGAQIEKTTSREACRDLSGRRMRDINNEKKLKEWLAKEAERERDREQRRQERLERRLATPQHKFEDPEYHEQRAKVQEDLQDALSKGLKRAHKKDGPSNASSSKKLKTTAGPSSSKAEWLGMDIDSDDLDSDSDNEAHPGDPDPQAESLSSAVVDSEGNSPIASESSSSPQISAIKEEIKEEPNTDNSGNSASFHVWSECDLNSEDKPSVLPNKSLKEETASVDEHKPDRDTKLQHSLLSSLPPPTNCSSNSNTEKTDNTSSDEPVDLEEYNSSKELAALGLERLKDALMSRGLKCGGTLEERAERLFSVKGLSPDQIDPSLFAKSKGKGKGKKSKQ